MHQILRLYYILHVYCNMLYVIHVCNITGASLVAVLRNSNKLQPVVLSSFHTNTKDIATTQQLIGTSTV